MAEGGAAAGNPAQHITIVREPFAFPDQGEETVTAAQYAALLAQLQVLAEFINSARQEIAIGGASEIVGRDVPAATDELEAVILHTAEATGLILDECEKLEAAGGTGLVGSVITEATTRIYEACSFQDITGQRVAKVVKTLVAIEAKVGEMLRMFGCGAADMASPYLSPALLNGPQRSGDAMEQQAVDALLASFE